MGSPRHGSGAAASRLQRPASDRPETSPGSEARQLIWRRVLDDASFEHACMCVGARGVELSGVVLIAHEGRPLRVDYAVHCDAHWRTRTVEVAQAHLGQRRVVSLERLEDGGWARDGVPLPDLAGCTDVDLAVSPSTNALPINRLRLEVGETRAIFAAWVLFPSLEVARAEQSYERIGPESYRYRGLATGFEAVVEVDDLGLPIAYGSIWRRIAAFGAVAPGLQDGFGPGS